MKPTLASAPESRDRKCSLEHIVPGKPEPACLEVASGWSGSLPGHLSIAKQPHPSLLAQLLFSLGCSKEFPPRENASLCCTWGTAPSFHPQLTREFELFPPPRPPPPAPLLQRVAKLQKTIRTSFGSSLPFQSRPALSSSPFFPWER